MPKYVYKEPKVEEIQPKVTIKDVKICSRIDAQISYSGHISGKQYYWAKAGDVVPVQEEDVSELLSKRLGKKLCCGGNEGNQIFEIVL